MRIGYWRMGLALAVFAPLCAAIDEVSVAPENAVAVTAPAWRELAESFAQQPDLTADFVEKRYFPFSKVPIVVKGEVRVSRPHGLSLRYTTPEQRIVIVDAQGMLVRDAEGQTIPPDPRAAMATSGMLNILRFDFAALEKEFELYGKREGDAWSLTLVSRNEKIRGTLGNILVSGEKAMVRTIELRRSARQHINIEISPTKASGAFTAEELKHYFR